VDTLYPASIRPGSVLTIEGDYLHLIKAVIFTPNLTVTELSSHSKTKIEVTVPVKAQTGVVTLSDGAAEPILIESSTALNVILPAITAVSPNPVKAGSNLTITGTDLDLVSTVIFGGLKKVTSFVGQSATQMTVTVPADAQDGNIKVVPASEVEVESSSALIMVVPTITHVTPNPAKTGSDITVKGSDLDLVTSVVFGGEKTGEIQTGGSATQITVTVPVDAVPGVVTLNTAANKMVVTAATLDLVKPAITNITPLTLLTKETVTITGTNLDIVDSVKFTGGRAVEVSGASETQLVVTVPAGSRSGTITLVATNGDEVVSSQSLTLTPADAPQITDMPVSAAPGSMLSIKGTDLDLLSEVIFPGNVKATMFGLKLDTLLEVFIPLNVQQGTGNITFVTVEGEQVVSPVITLLGIEPVADPALIINDFDETGHDLTWDNWDGNVELGNDPAIAISGKYLHGINDNLSSWKWIWGCNHAELFKPTVTKADHEFKMDINITRPISSSTTINFQMEFAGVRVDLGPLGVPNPDGSYSTTGWITMTWDLSSFSILPETVGGDGEWGLNLGSGSGLDITGLYIDNIRFEEK
ncbi:MAG: IPT/TIG domain-containing protein, partial [Bacteroidales bacterium]|nr:IPT/TIG domain-containing protein [Bacteroidales bacterium]